MKVKWRSNVAMKGKYGFDAQYLFGEIQVLEFSLFLASPI
jgi:hypothetical protein